MLSTINETYLFQQDLLTVKMFPSIQQMGKCAATEVTNKICELLKEKAEINMIFAAAPSQNEFLSHLIHSKQIDWSRINAFHMDEYIGIHPEAPQSFGNFLRLNPEKPDVPLNKNDAFQKVQKRRVQEKR